MPTADREKGYSLRDWFRSLGPGLITAALIFGPSKMTITSKLGAQYGSSLLWVVLVTATLMVFFTTMSARIGVVSDKSLLQLMGQKWGRWASVVVGLGVFLVCASFQSGNAVGVGIALGELTGTAPQLWIICFTVFGIALLFFKSFYKVLEKLMIVLILIMLLSFVLTLFWSPPNWSLVLEGFRFRVPEGSQGLIIAFFASSFSVVGAVYQAYLVQERKLASPDRDPNKNGSVPGIILLGLMSAITLMAAANILYPRGINPQTASDMGRALEPIFGAKAHLVFLVGLFGAAFSSLVGNATVGGSLLSDGLGWGGQFSSIRPRFLIALVMIIGATVAIVFGKLPLELIIFAQSITIFVVPFIAIAMFLIANDRNLMGPLRNNRWQNFFCGIGILLILVLALLNFKDWFLK